MKRLEEIIREIQPLNVQKIQAGQHLCDQLAKPIGSLGKMETIYTRLYAMFNGSIRLQKKTVIVYAADNGLVAEQISSNPQETTFIVSKNMLAGRTGLCAISEHAGSDVCLVDIGCKQDIFPEEPCKIMRGTKNSLLEPAMTQEECRAAILSGYEKTCRLIQTGYTLFGTGEMGIGNTSTSAAVIAALLGLKAEQVTGYGSGLTESMLAHKTAVIQGVIERHAPYGDIIDLVSKVGGLDMLGMAGTYLACAQHQLPCVIDGLISLTGLLIANQLTPYVLDYCFASHFSTEPGYKIVSDYLGLTPMLFMDMRLGEGSGCPLAFFLMENAVYTMEHMPTFAESKLKQGNYIDIRGKSD